MDFQTPYPFVPELLFGLILEKNGLRYLLWIPEGLVEGWSPLADEGQSFVPDASSIETVQQIVSYLVRAGVRRPLDLRQRLSEGGFLCLGARQYDFASGRLYQAAATLVEESIRMNSERTQILNSHNGGPPKPGNPDWRYWERLHWRLHGFSQGARLLGVAALDALANEILYVRFRDEYQKLEGPGKSTGLLKKMRRVLSMAGADPNPKWLDLLEAENRTRRLVVHHEPGYVDDFSSLDSLDLAEAIDPESLSAFLDTVDQAIVGLFDAFSTPVPPTHLRQH